MTRYRLVLEYNGYRFHGWQRQLRSPTIQSSLEEALSGLCGHPVVVVGAGRTDTGVHALGQVAHFDTTRPRPDWVIVRALNARLPSGVSVLAAARVTADFHARFSARYREYCYRILIRRERPALERYFVWHHPLPLEEERMVEAAEVLLGTHDYSAFRAAGCQARSPVRTVTRMEVVREGVQLSIWMGANAFLQHMVRNVVGSLAKVGRGEWDVATFCEIFQGRDRTRAGPTAPPEGLYLVRVDY